jgi:hypothetical protein
MNRLRVEGVAAVLAGHAVKDGAVELFANL